MENRLNLIRHTGFACLLAALALGTLAAPGAALAQTRTAAQPRIAITDVRGRTVKVPRNASRLLIDDGRFLIALALIHPDPASVVVGWPRDINRIGTHAYNQLRTRFPAIERIAQTSSSAGTFSLEKALSVNPDVAVFTAGTGPSEEQVRVLEKAGIPVVFIDFIGRPFTNLEPSLRILGQLTGRQARAEQFIELRNSRLALIEERLKANPRAGRPKVFFEAHAGISEECCNSPGKGSIGDYITFVGGHNIGADVLPGHTGRLNLEYVLSQDPAVYIATGGPHLEKAGGLVVGPGFTPAQARSSLVRMTQRQGISMLSAVRRGRVHGIAHQLLNSPLDILAIEALAKWIHPTLFSDLDPQATLKEINQHFLVVPLEGTNWINLR